MTQPSLTSWLHLRSQNLNENELNMMFDVETTDSTITAHLYGLIAIQTLKTGVHIMSCIANFYLDGIKYSLEDFDMNNSTIQNLLKRVIISAKLSSEEKANQSNLCYSERIDLFGDESPGNIDLENGEQETLNDTDDETLLNSLKLL